jgi:acyl-CoA reductase-like NAD-dependent aldehyde dehydrogenase
MNPAAVQNRQLFINGEWQAALGNRTFEKNNPFTGETISRFSCAGRNDAARAIDAVSAAFPE